MFSGYEKKEIEDKLPNILNPIYQFFKRIDNRYNQVVINYYESEHDSIALHSDWDDNMINNYEISILILNKNNNKNTYFTIVSKNNNKNNNCIEIELIDGLIITMGGKFKKNYKHGIYF
jgi:alkylated DNA repair dioxygenase AlkB